MESKYLIIGNSTAGTACIEGIRENDKGGRIIVISDEANYSRPLISYYLGGKITKDRLSFRDSAFYKENNVEVILKRVDMLDCENKCVLLDGEKINFEKLLIATGGLPIIPRIDGLDKVKEGLFTFVSLSDTQNIIDYIEANKIKKGVVLGGGLIGLKCTEGLVERGLKVTIVELADRILANTFDNTSSEILESALADCKVLKEDTIVGIDSSKGRITRISLKKGMEISTNLLIIAVGVRPNLGLIKDTTIAYGKGIITNSYMETNVKDIYAAGDCAENRDILTGENSVIAIWPLASYQGRIAGYNMAGKKREYPGLFLMNSVVLAGIPTISFGITNPSGDEYEILCRNDEFYRKIVLRDNKIVGVIFVGHIERAGIFWGLIRDRVDVLSFKDKLLSDDFGLLVLPKEYRKHLIIGEEVAI